MVLPGRADDRVEFQRLVPADADLLVKFLTGGDWPYFADVITDTRPWTGGESS